MLCASTETQKGFTSPSQLSLSLSFETGAHWITWASLNPLASAFQCWNYSHAPSFLPKRKRIKISKHNTFCLYKIKNWVKYCPPNPALANSDQELWSSSCDLHLTEFYYFKCHLNITKCLLIPTANSLSSFHLLDLLNMAPDSYSLPRELQSTLLPIKVTNVKLSLTFWDIDGEKSCIFIFKNNTKTILWDISFNLSRY